MKTAIIAIVMFAVLIFVHELGHFLAAKACHVKVNRFALGMGPALFKRKRGETEYSLRAFPIGGFCEMEGEDEESGDERAFNNKKAWQKALILVAGPFMNVLLALLLMIVVLAVVGQPTTTIESTVKGSPAQAIGLTQGDVLLQVDGKEIVQWTDVSKAVEEAQGPTMEVVIQRDGEELILTCGTMEQEGRCILGVTPARAVDFKAALVAAPKATWDLTKQMYIMLKQLVTGQASMKEMTGPVGIVYMVNETAKTGAINLLYFMALISLNLGVINLLPFPALDGGRLLFVLIRKLTGKVITDEIEAKINFAGILLLFALMIYVTWQDIWRFIAPLF